MFITVLGAGILAVRRSRIFRKETCLSKSQGFPHGPLYPGDYRGGCVQGEKCCGSRKGSMAVHLGSHAPGSSPEGRREAVGAWVGTRVLRSGWVGRRLYRTTRGVLCGTAAQDRGVSSPASILQVSALMHFYLLGEARPPAARGCGMLGARWSTRTAAAALRQLRGHLRDGAGSGAVLSGATGALSGGFSVHCSACRGTSCEREETGLGASFAARRGGG